MPYAYAGIGSRDTPYGILQRMKVLGSAWGTLGYVLRSGAAGGADTAFEKGCDNVKGPKEIYLPWLGFENRGANQSDVIYHLTPDHFDLAQRILGPSHWGSLGQGGQKLMARNMSQVLGRDLKRPVGFVACYTTGGKFVGGTAAALRLAHERNIPVLNLGSFEWIKAPVHVLLQWAADL